MKKPRIVLPKIPWFSLALDVSMLGGAAMVAFGAWSIYEPAGFITGGALLIAGSYRMAGAK